MDPSDQSYWTPPKDVGPILPGKESSEGDESTQRALVEKGALGGRDTNTELAQISTESSPFQIFWNERTLGNSTWPTFVQGWPKDKDPRFYDNENPLYNKKANPKVDWREGINYITFINFIEYCRVKYLKLPVRDVKQWIPSSDKKSIYKKMLLKEKLKEQHNPMQKEFWESSMPSVEKLEKFLQDDNSSETRSKKKKKKKTKAISNVADDPKVKDKLLDTIARLETKKVMEEQDVHQMVENVACGMCHKTGQPIATPAQIEQALSTQCSKCNKLMRLPLPALHPSPCHETLQEKISALKPLKQQEKKSCEVRAARKTSSSDSQAFLSGPDMIRSLASDSSAVQFHKYNPAECNESARAFPKSMVDLCFEAGTVQATAEKKGDKVVVSFQLLELYAFDPFHDYPLVVPLAQIKEKRSKQRERGEKRDLIWQPLCWAENYSHFLPREGCQRCPFQVQARIAWGSVSHAEQGHGAVATADKLWEQSDASGT